MDGGGGGGPRSLESGWYRTKRSEYFEFISCRILVTQEEWTMNQSISRSVG